MDVRNLTFEDGTFDIAIDKGKHFPVRFRLTDDMHNFIGTMDAMMTAKGDVWVGFLCITTSLARISSPAYRILHNKS